MRAQRIVALLAVAGAVGASACAAFLSDFTTNENADGGASADGGESDASAATDGADGTAAADAHADAALDAGLEAARDAEAGAMVDGGCTLTEASVVVCGSQFTTPAEFCENVNGGTSGVPTPAACQCAGLFTCACLKAAYAPPGGWCATTTADAGCFCHDQPTGPVVFCDFGCNG